jgi:hypothetical protein
MKTILSIRAKAYNHAKLGASEPSICNKHGPKKMHDIEASI